LSDEVLDAKIKSGALYQGKIQCRASNPEGTYCNSYNIAYKTRNIYFFIIEAEVRLGEKSVLGRDILIPSKILRNRSVHGDIVAVEVLSPNDNLTLVY